MDTTKNKSISINDQVVAITQQSAKLRNSLDSQSAPQVIDGLKTLENSLERVSELIIPFELQYSHLKALAGIGITSAARTRATPDSLTIRNQGLGCSLRTSGPWARAFQCANP